MFSRYIIILFLSFLIGSPSFALTLKEAVDSALENNPEIHAQASSIDGVKSQIDQVVSNFYPTIAIQGAYGRSYRTPITYTMTQTAVTTGEIEIPPFPPVEITPETEIEPVTLESYADEPQTARNYGITFTQLLYSGSRRIHQFEIAQANLQIAQEGLERKKQDLAYQVVEAYYGVLLHKKMLDLNLQSEDIARAHLEQAQNYFSLGRISNADLLRAKIKLAEERFSRIEAENKLESAKVALNDILGREIDQPVQIEGDLLVISESNLPSSEKITAMAFENRPEWGILDFKKIIRERKVGIAKADYFPSLALQASYNKNNLDPDTPPERITTGILESESWYVTGVFSWKIFDSFRTRNKVKEAEAGLEELKARVKQMRSRILSEIKKARLYFHAAKSKIKVAKEQVELSEDNLRQVLENYRSGIAGNLEQLEAEKMLNEAKANLFQAVADLELAKAKINLAVGKTVFAIY